ncbi:MAG: exosortase/archaeosortase family protein, partial [Verrucomicrobiota bacterium]
MPPSLFKDRIPWFAWLFPWGMLAVHLSAFWRTIPQYAFGWLVLPLAAYFLHRRWQSVPFEPARASWASPVALVCALLMLPAWMIRTAAPHSYHVSYGMALLAAGFTLALLAHGGGWRMARYMAFPVLFVFCAVPWSRHLEGPLIESLTRMVTIVTVEALQLSGVAATRTGNLVSLSTGTLDVAEACSGIRSFQSMIMAALALGELHRFGVTRRIALVGIGAGLALFFNLLRNYLLAVLAHSRGLGAIDTWHDASGWGIFLISFYLLHQLSERMEGGFEPPRREPPALRKFPAWAGPALSVWFITVVAATEGWYRSHEHNITETITVEWPRRKNSYRIQPVPPATREFLRCSSIEIAAWSEENATQWILSAVRWDPGETSTNAAQSHHPEVCL